MSKVQVKGLAKKYYLGGKKQKEIAQILKITEATVSKWATEGKWKAERDARMNSSKERLEAIKEVISQLTNKRLNVFKEIEEAENNGDKATLFDLKKESAALSQEVAIQTKALERMEKDSRISLATYLEVMDSIFSALNQYDQATYMKTIDFQEAHLSDISLKLG